MLDWYSVDSGVATTRGRDVIGYLNVSESFSTLLPSKPKVLQASLKGEKYFKMLIFFLVSSF